MLQIKTKLLNILCLNKAKNYWTKSIIKYFQIGEQSQIVANRLKKKKRNSQKEYDFNDDK